MILDRCTTLSFSALLLLAASNLDGKTGFIFYPGGLVLMASYASGSVDLSDWNGAVLSISLENQHQQIIEQTQNFYLENGFE